MESEWEFIFKFCEIFTHLRHIIQNVHNTIHVSTCDLHATYVCESTPNNDVEDGLKHIYVAWVEVMQSLKPRAFRVNNLSPTMYAKCKAFMSTNDKVTLYKQWE